MGKIVLIDDQVEICDFLCSYFNEKGFEAHAANGGTEGLSLVEQIQPDLVICDVRMPEISGIDVLREIKQRFPQIKVIMVTAIDAQEVVDEAMSLGASDYVTKPFSLSYLDEEVIPKVSDLIQ